MAILAIVVVMSLLLMGILSLTSNIQPVKAIGTIYIRADGIVDPSDAPISNAGNITYAFTDNVYVEIVVERSNIVIDGNGYTLQGSGLGKGFDLSGINNVTIKNTDIRDFHYGVGLANSDNNSLSGNNITNNDYGVYLWQSLNNTISGNNITNNNWHGIGISSYSNNNILSGNNITNNYDGLCLYSYSSIVYGNNITANKQYGVRLESSSNNNLSGNVINDNKYNFGVCGSWQLRDFMHSIDVSNLINGKPVYYLVNQKDLVINPSTHPQVGYLALINCANITVEGLTLTNNSQGILLSHTGNSRIASNNITNNEYGVCLSWSSLNTVSGNNITNNIDGVYFDTGSSNTVSGNNITNNNHGVEFSWSPSNTVSGNNITNNDCGVMLFSCGGRGSCFNRFYHNNLIDNTKQVSNIFCEDTARYPNDWDDGVEGNFWSNYTGVDSKHDGIGDFLHAIDVNNQDNYPLMGIFHSLNTSLGYQVNVISNSTIEDFHYFESNNTIKLHVSNMTATQAYGFCRIRIPHTLMNGTYHVTVNGAEPHYVNYTLYDDEDNRWIYFSYEHSTLEIVIIPEFPSALILPLFMITTLLAVIVYRRKHTIR